MALPGPVHRRVGIAQQLFAGAVARVPQGDAQAAGRKQFAPGDPHRFLQRQQQPLAEIQRAPALRALQQHANSSPPSRATTSVPAIDTMRWPPPPACGHRRHGRCCR
jgi:hypothetical protein